MKFREMMEPDAYKQLVAQLRRQRDISIERTLDHARNGELPTVRYNSGVTHGLTKALQILEGD